MSRPFAIVTGALSLVGITGVIHFMTGFGVPAAYALAEWGAHRVTERERSRRRP